MKTNPSTWQLLINASATKIREDQKKLRKFSLEDTSGLGNLPTREVFAKLESGDVPSTPLVQEE